MGLDGLAAAHGRIAHIRSLFDATGPLTSRQAVTSQTLGLADTSQDASSRIDTAFNDVLTQVSQANATGAASGPAEAGEGRGARFGQFARDVLNGIGAPVTAENVRALKAWALAEGTKAQHNPLATTRRYANTTNFNSIGVKNYASYENGIAATIETLKNGRYPNILAAFAQGNSAEAIGLAVAQSPWGTGQGVLRVLRNGNV